VKGQKHQRIIALLRRMGKPVPQMYQENTGANFVEAQGMPIPTVGSTGPLKKVVGVTGTKFVGGTTLLTTGEELKTGAGTVPSITGAVKPQDLEVWLFYPLAYRNIFHLRKHYWATRMQNPLDKNSLKKKRIQMENLSHTTANYVIANSVILEQKIST
jgi:hypothetical protein